MKANGVKHTTVGFMGGHLEHPSYKDVCTQTTGHLETTEVVFDTSVTSYDDMVRLFFETHDFTQTNGQGPDIGQQYLSCIFYTNDIQKNITLRIKNNSVSIYPNLSFVCREIGRAHV